MSKKSAPVVSNVSVTPASGPGGTIFTATVTASGFPSLRISYQWRLDGVTIPGATGADFIASAAGSLTVRVTATNNEGTDTRDSAPVIVSPALAAPAITEARIAPEIGAVDDVFTVFAEAAGVPAPALSYQWALDGIAIGGATKASYFAIARGNLSVCVTARNSEGADSIESEPVAVAPALAAPTITALRIEPEAGRVGDSFSAIVEAGGIPSPDLTYQWLLDGIAVGGANDSVFAATADGALSVMVTAINAEGIDSRESAAVRVDPALEAPQLLSASITPEAGRVGELFAVTSTATGNPVPELSYQWRIDGEEIVGATASGFVPATEGSFSVRVTAVNAVGSYTIETDPVIVAAALQAPVIGNVAIAPETGRAGDVFTAVVETSGNPAPELAYQWLLDGVAVDGATGASFAPGAAGALSLQVTATNSEGSDVGGSGAVIVEPALEAPRLTALAISPETGRVGDSFAATATVTGEPVPALGYQWLLDGLEIEGATGTLIIAASEGSLSVRATATNAAGSDSVESEMVPVAAALEAPGITGLSIAPDTGQIGDVFTAFVEVTGNPEPQIGYQWLIDGLAVDGATGANFAPQASGALSVQVTGTNSEGTASGLSGTVLVEPAPAAPQVKFADILPNVGRVGDTFTVTAKACGYPVPDVRYVWVLEDQVIEGATDISYTAAKVGTLFVRVIATNSEAEDIRESGAVEVEPALVAPSITDATIQPSAGRVWDTFLVSVAATGNPAPVLAFQWLMDGMEIAGANAGTFVPAAEGSLSVQVTATNSEGSDSRETETISVATALAAPQITKARIEPSEGRVGDAFTAFVEATGNPEPLVSYRWTLDGVPVAGATSQNLTADTVGVLGVRTTARNSEGEITAEAVPVTVEAALAPPVLTAATIAPASGQVGVTFTASVAASGNPTPVFNYQWLLSGVAIFGATAPSYSATSPGTLTVRVTASNSLGTDSLESGAATITSDPSPTVFETGTFEEGVFA